MTRILQIAHLVLLLTGAGLCVSGGVLIWHVDKLVTVTSSQVGQTLSGAQAVEVQLAVTLEAVNRPCGGGRPCGLLADAAKTLNTARLTLGQVEVVANHEDQRIGVLDAQEAQIAADTHLLLTKAGGNLDTLNATVRGVQPVEQGATEEIAELRTMTQGLAKLTPDLQRTADSLSSMSANANATTLHLNATTADVQQAVHRYLHPTWPQRVWSAIANTGVEVGKFFF